MKAANENNSKILDLIANAFFKIYSFNIRLIYCLLRSMQLVRTRLHCSDNRRWLKPCRAINTTHYFLPQTLTVPLEYPLKKKPSLARLKLWKRYETWPYCTYYLREICLLSPRELPMLMTSRQLFANKFKPDHRPLGYDCLEEWYFNKIIKELQTGRVQLDLRPYYIINYKHLGL